MTIVITGGHLTPALAFIEYIKANAQDTLYFYGRKYSQPRTKQLAKEKQEVAKLQVPFFAISARSIIGKSIATKIAHLSWMGLAVLQSIILLLKHRPEVVVSFGSYVGVPVAIAAKLLAIPVILHEQTLTPGASSYYIAKLSQIVAVGHQQTKTAFDHSRVEVTGNPIRSSLLAFVPTQPIWGKHLLDDSLPLLYVTGGNQGSATINQLIESLLPSLLKKCAVVHQCGSSSTKFQWLNQLKKVSRQLPPELQSRYHLQEWYSSQELGWIYSHANAVVGRAGANTVTELWAFRLPSLLVPLPHAHDNEQLKNAEFLANNRAALILEEDHLDAKTFSLAIDSLITQADDIRQAFEHNPMFQVDPRNAASRLYSLLAQL